MSSQQWLERIADILLSSRPSLIDWGSVAVVCFIASLLPGSFLLDRLLYPCRYDMSWRSAYVIAGGLFMFMLVTIIMGWL